MSKMNVLNAIGTGMVIGATLANAINKKSNQRQREDKYTVTKKVTGGVVTKTISYDDGFSIIHVSAPNGFWSETKLKNGKEISYRDSCGERVKYFPSGRDKEHIFPDGTRFIFNESGICTYKESNGMAYIYDSDGKLLRTIKAEKKEV